MDIVSEETLTLIANIIGSDSAASKALSNIDRMRSEGREPICVKNGSSFVVLDATKPQGN